MDFVTGASICIFAFLFLLLLGVPVAFNLLFICITIGALTFGGAFVDKAGWTPFEVLFDLSWTPLPLFVLLACIIAETSIGEDLYLAARNWTSRVPGGLIVATIVGEAAMAAAVGTSGACILALGKVAEPEFKRYGYDKSLSFGGLCCAGVLGPLIPPSTTMVIYAVLAGVSLGHLLIGGIIPGIILAVLLSIIPVIFCIRNPNLGPVLGRVRWRTRFASLKKTWPVVLVFVAILGSIYLGIATPTESAGFGCVIIIIIAIAFFGLRFKELRRAMKETAILNAMVMIIIIGASLFAYVIGSSGLAQLLANYIVSSGLPPLIIIIAISVTTLILGCFLPGISIMILTIPIFVPIIEVLGYDLIWFGILFVVNIQIGLVTPPMGIDLFVTRAAFDITMSQLIRGILPYLIVLIIFLFVLILFPQLSLWLPALMKT